MKLTEEQQKIISSSGSIKINAVAGSGKTTTLVEYARSRPGTAKILYLAFNRSVKLEAERKFAEQGLKNVRVDTAHSLALPYVFRGQRIQVKPGYKSHEIASMLNLRGSQEKHEQFILANHIRKFVSYFCNSAQSKVRDLDYRSVVFDPEAKSYVDKVYGKIEQGTRQFLANMHEGRIGIVHDYYLKQFQLQAPSLPYDFILFDEGQDASGCMLDVFLKQRATQVIVGDTHQQIYSWRFAINSLEQVAFPGFNLSSSFRFDHNIAELANEILGWKSHFKEHESAQIKGAGGLSSVTTRATIARTNLALLIRAIDFIQSNRNSKVYFEGNLSSYTYADEGASIYDVFNLYYGKSDRVKDPLIRSMKDIDELRDYIEKTEDAELSMVIDVIDEYGKDLPGLLRKLKECHVADGDKHKADMIFSTVHRSKGMEYDEVTLAADFTSEKKLLKQLREGTREKVNTAAMNEEVNLLYVAATRTKNVLNIPEELTDRKTEGNIRVISPGPKEEDGPGERETTPPRKIPVYTVAEKRKQSVNAYQPWTRELDDEMKELFSNNWDEVRLAKHFGRNPGAIRARIKKLGLYDG